MYAISVLIEKAIKSSPKDYKIAFSPTLCGFWVRIPLILWWQIHANFATGRIAYSRSSSIEGKEIAFKWATQMYEGRGKGADRSLRPAPPATPTLRARENLVMLIRGNIPRF